MSEGIAPTLKEGISDFHKNEKKRFQLSHLVGNVSFHHSIRIPSVSKFLSMITKKILQSTCT